MSLENYEILEELGRGRYDVVYQVLDLTNKREVAIKNGLIMKSEIENHLSLNKCHSYRVSYLYSY